MFVVDASVWVARYLPSDRFHEVSEAWLRERLSEGMMLRAPALLLPEVAGAVARRTANARSAERVRQEILRLARLGLIALDNPPWRRAAALAIVHRLAGADAVYLALAEALDVPFVTWDTEPLERAGPRARRPPEAGPPATA